MATESRTICNFFAILTRVLTWPSNHELKKLLNESLDSYFTNSDVDIIDLLTILRNVSCAYLSQVIEKEGTLFEEPLELFDLHHEMLRIRLQTALQKRDIYLESLEDTSNTLVTHDDGTTRTLKAYAQEELNALYDSPTQHTVNSPIDSIADSPLNDCKDLNSTCTSERGEKLVPQEDSELLAVDQEDYYHQQFIEDMLTLQEIDEQKKDELNSDQEEEVKQVMQSIEKITAFSYVTPSHSVYSPLEEENDTPQSDISNIRTITVEPVKQEEIPWLGHSAQDILDELSAQDILRELNAYEFNGTGCLDVLTLEREKKVKKEEEELVHPKEKLPLLEISECNFKINNVPPPKKENKGPRTSEKNEEERANKKVKMEGLLWGCFSDSESYIIDFEDWNDDESEIS